MPGVSPLLPRYRTRGSSLLISGSIATTALALIQTPSSTSIQWVACPWNSLILRWTSSVRLPSRLRVFRNFSPVTSVNVIASTAAGILLGRGRRRTERRSIRESMSANHATVLSLTASSKRSADDDWFREHANVTVHRFDASSDLGDAAAARACVDRPGAERPGAWTGLLAVVCQMV